MRPTLFLPLAFILLVSACGVVRDSAINPANWFGRSQLEPVVQDTKAQTNPLIPQDRRRGLFARLRQNTSVYSGTPVDQITNLVIERAPGGAIIRATGIADQDRVYDVRLTTESEENTPIDGVLTYQLRAVHSANASRTLSQQVRTVTAARVLTNEELQNIRVIRVEGLRNAQSTQRR